MALVLYGSALSSPARPHQLHAEAIRIIKRAHLEVHKEVLRNCFDWWHLPQGYTSVDPVVQIKHMFTVYLCASRLYERQKGNFAWRADQELTQLVVEFVGQMVDHGFSKAEVDTAAATMYADITAALHGNLLQVPTIREAIALKSIGTISKSDSDALAATLWRALQPLDVEYQGAVWQRLAKPSETNSYFNRVADRIERDATESLAVPY